MNLKEKDYRWNFIVNSIDNAFFNLGMTFGSIQTLLPLFAKHLGAGNLEIGLIPAIANLGWAIPAIIGAKYSEKYKIKLHLVLKVTMGERLPYLFMALIAFFVAPNNPTLALYLSLLMLGIATFSMGFLGPPWMSMIGKVIEPSKRGVFFAMGNGLGAIMGIGGAGIARIILSRYLFPHNFGYSFLCASIALLISFVFLALTREYPDDQENPDVPLLEYLKSIKTVFKHKNFKNYVIARILNAFSVPFISFVVVFASKTFSIPDKIAADFTAILLISQAISSFLLGPLGDKYGHKLPLLIGKILILLDILILLFAKNISYIYIAFILVGFINSAFWVGDSAMVLEISPSQHKELYIGALSLILSPFSFVAPIIAGKIADVKGFQFLFITCLLISIINIVFFIYGVKDPRKDVENINNINNN